MPIQVTGKVSPISRDKQIEQFTKEKDIKIMISTLKTGGVGLNLTMVNKCIFVDPWWNEAIQDQVRESSFRFQTDWTKFAR